MTAGRVERIGPDLINVYDEHNLWLEYFSGDALRSWCIFDRHGLPHQDWKSVQREDAHHMISTALRQRRGV